MSLFEDSDSTSETASLSSTESETNLNLIDIKNWLEFHYGTYRRPKKAFKTEEGISENKNKFDIEFDITSALDYESDLDLSTRVNESQKVTYGKLEAISYAILDTSHILEEEEHLRYGIHNCIEEDKLIVSLGIRYVLTDKLPVCWIPSLLVDIILEAAAYCATNPSIQRPEFIRDLYLIHKIAKPWTDDFAHLPEYIKRGTYDYHWVSQISRTGPFKGLSNDLPIAYRHRPWNQYFRKKSSSVRDILCQARNNTEGNPQFLVGRLQRGIIRTIDNSERHIISVVRGGKIRNTLLESQYINSNTTNTTTETQYESGTAENPVEV